MQETQEMYSQALGWEDPPEEEMATHSSILVWKIRQRSLVGYSPRVCKKSDTTEHVNREKTMCSFRGNFLNFSLHFVYYFASSKKNCKNDICVCVIYKKEKLMNREASL